MKFSTKNAKHFFAISLLSIMIFTAFWAILAHIVMPQDTVALAKTIPLSLDLYIIKLTLNLNIGSVIGLPVGVLIFKTL
ncbi:MAG: hypothetical protein JXR63_01170 [Spirochaetales bacterium]|nr:hypothetical protein [Spirochaetales bacterium]